MERFDTVSRRLGPRPIPIVSPTPDLHSQEGVPKSSRDCAPIKGCTHRGGEGEVSIIIHSHCVWTIFVEMCPAYGAISSNACVALFAYRELDEFNSPWVVFHYDIHGCC